ncbi:MAG: 3-hydroxyacyl-CoA dehydrogenase NAD-binding domain-containing protein [Pseudomonadota bacterium]
MVDIELHGDVATIALNNPPVNAMSHALRQGLVAALSELDANPDINAIGLYGIGPGLSAGADISEMDAPQKSPLPPDVTHAIETCGTPVAAILHGNVLGGGFEMGLAAHARVAHPKAKLGLPEVNIGLIPGAGGCIRSARLAGLDAAATLVTSGRPIDAARALELGLIDRIDEGDPAAMAVQAARDLADGTMPARISSDQPLAPDAAGGLDAARASIAARSPFLDAPKRAIDAVAAATLPRNEALAREQALFFECLKGPQSAALIHAFFAERSVWKIPEAKLAPRDIASIGVIGGGTMGSGIATAALLSGLPVTLVEQGADALDRAKATITRNLDGAVTRGKLSQERRDHLLGADLSISETLADLATVDLIIEAVFEDMGVKKQIFTQLDQIAKDGAILASNTSALNLDDIAAMTGRPQDVIGLHFFSPAHVMKLLEVVVGARTAPETTATGFALAKRLRKIPVRAGVCDGFIGNRILYHYLNAADDLLLRGASPAQVDAAMEGIGFALGPFAVNDLAGIDISVATRAGTATAAGLEQRMAERGWLGRKSGAGYYLYEGRKKQVNADLAPVLDAVRAEIGLPQRSFEPSELTDRILTAMICEAVRVLEDGIALKPSDIDAVFLFGYGFPRHLGGPMHLADVIGATEILQRIAAYAEDDPGFWHEPKSLRSMLEHGGRFADLNR